MLMNKIRVFLLSTTMLLVFIVLGITGLINFVSFSQSYYESLAANYNVLANQAVRKIEYAVKYGKPLTNFYGIEEILTNLMKVEHLKEVQVVLPSGEVLYNQDGFVENEYLSPSLQEKVNFLNKDVDVVYRVDENHYYVFTPIYDGNHRWIASLSLIFDEDVVLSGVNQFVYQSICLFIFFSIIVFVFVFQYLKKMPIISARNKLLRKRVVFFIVAIFSVVQVIYGIINYVHLRNGYLDFVTENTSMALQVIKNDIEGVLNKGVLYSDLYGVGEYMKEIIDSLPEISRISIVDYDFTTKSINEDSNTMYSYSSILIKDSLGEKEYLIDVDLSKEHLDQKMQGILLNTVTMIILGIFLTVEFINFILFYIERKIENIGNGKMQNKMHINRVFIRPVSFITFASVFLTASYIPILMDEFVSHSWSLHLLGLPLLLEITCTLLAFLLANPFCNRSGWRNVFLIGIIIIILGSLVSALSWNSLSFIISRMIAGIGFGCILQGLYRCCYHAYFSKKNNQEAFSLFQSGSIAGMFFGIIVGAVVADEVGMLTVYFIAIPLFLLAALLVMKFMPNFVEKRVIRRRLHFKNIPKRRIFFANLHVNSFLYFIAMPFSMISMILYFIVPVIASGFHFTIANIGRLFLFQGLLFVFLIPIYRKHIIKLISIKSSLFISSLLIASGLILYAFLPSTLSLMIMIGLFGVGMTLSVATQSLYFQQLYEMSSLEEGKAMGYFYIYENLGKIVGVILIAIIYTFLGEKLGFMFMSGLLLFMTILFMIISRCMTMKTTNLSLESVNMDHEFH